MNSNMLQLTVFLFAFSSLVLVGSVMSPNSVLASQDIEQPENPPPDQNHVDVYNNQGQCIKNHKSYDKSNLDNHCKNNNNN